MKLKNTFVQGKMNKDIDERLLPKGQYPHAENVRVANTDSSDMGAIENVMGNNQLTLFNLTNAKTIGAFADSSSQKIYWFTTSDEKDLVVEYDLLNSQTNILLESSNPNGVLNFDKNYLITGIVKIINGDSKKDLLVWTDDINPPRVINLVRAQTYGVDGFIEDDISLIKKPPRFAPDVNLTFTANSIENNLEDKFLSFAYRYEYLDGERSAISSFTNYKFAPEKFDLDYQTMENNGMVNSFNAVDIIFNTGDERVVGVELVFKESNSNKVSIIEKFNKAQEGWGDNTTQSFQFANAKKYTALPEDELFRPYDNVPRVAKALDMIGNRLVFGNYVEGYDLTNVFGEDIHIDYDVSVINKDLSGEPIDTTLSNTIITNDTWVIDLTGIVLINGSRLSFEPDVNEQNGDGNFNDTFDFILNRDFTDATDLATDPDFIFFIESVMTGRFLQEYSNTPPVDSEVNGNTDFVIVSSTANTVSIQAPIIEYGIYDYTDPTNPILLSTEFHNWYFATGSNAFFKEIAVDTSLKTNRSYEVGIVYLDEHNRATTVLTDSDNTEYVDQEFSTFQNKLMVNINHQPPYWADRYKLVVKQNKGNYHTIYTNIFYTDGLFRWVKIEGANKDKVKEGDTLIVKSDLGGVVEDVIKVRVLEVDVKDKDFLEDNEDADGNDIIEEAGKYMKIKPVGFDMNADEATQRTFEGGSHRRYPHRNLTQPSFMNPNDPAVPLKLTAGSSVRIYIKFKARGKIAYEGTYDKSFRVSADYASVKEWFDTEVEDLGSFGQDYTWNGVSGIGSNICVGSGLADSKNRFSGWGFAENDCDGYTSVAAEPPNHFFVVPHRKGTSSRNISTTVRFEIRFSEGTVIFETEPEDVDSNIFYETEDTYEIINGQHQGNVVNQSSSPVSPATIELDFFNCYVQGNGAESYRYKDAFNTKYLNIDLRPMATSLEKYKEVRRYADLTYSESYNENNNINGINEFNLARANYKEDIDKKYGHIQKLYSRDTDILVFQEDKVSKVLYGKDLLMNADGTSNVSSIEDVLGQQVTFKGEYGISRNPESFAFDGYNIYFTDAKRGAVMRLSNNGLTEISNNGLRQFFKDEFKDSINNEKVAAFDPYQDQYVLHPSSDSNILPINMNCDDAPLYISNFQGELEIYIDYGTIVDNFSSEKVRIELLDGSNLDYELSRDGVVITGGTIITAPQGVILSNKKSTPLPTFYKLVINSDECVSFKVIPKCVSPQEFKIINVILNDDRDENLSMRSRYKWSTGGYISSFNTHNSLFGLGEVEKYDIVNGAEGSTPIPITGSTVYLESYDGSGQTASFLEDNKLGYYISNTLYPEVDYQVVVDNAVFPVITETVLASGDISNSIEFPVNRPSNEEYLYLIWDYRDEELVININTKIMIYFDSSGSMDTTLAPLQSMRDTILKARLLPLYNNDSAAYDANVTVIQESNERTLNMLDMQGATPTGNVIVMVFQDEAQSIYHGSGIISPRTAPYDGDLLTLKNRLNSYPNDYYRGIVFQVNGNATFPTFIQAVENGTGDYAGINGLSDKIEFGYVYNVDDGHDGTPDGDNGETYYLNLIVTALQNLGYVL